MAARGRPRIGLPPGGRSSRDIHARPTHAGPGTEPGGTPVVRRRPPVVAEGVPGATGTDRAHARTGAVERCRAASRPIASWHEGGTRPDGLGGSG